MREVLDLLLAPGFLANGPVRIALRVGSVAAVVSAVVGLFTVVRGRSFAGHALADVSSAGGAAAFLLGMSPLFGFLAMSVAGAGVIEYADAHESHEGDVLTGIVLGVGLGLTALLLFLDMRTPGASGAAVTVLFGSMFTLARSLVPVALGAAAIAVTAIAAVYRPLLLSALLTDLAQAQGIGVRRAGFMHAVALALAVTLSALTVGAILSTALLIGPAAAALRLADRPGRALMLAASIGLAATWGGVLMAYDSFYWTPGRGWPVSFCIVLLIGVAYLAASIAARARAVPAGGRPVIRSGCERH